MSSILRYKVEADRNENLVLQSDEDHWASIHCPSKQSLKNLLIRALGTWDLYKNLAIL